MARFTSENAAEHGRRGGQQSHQRIEEKYAGLVPSNPSATVSAADVKRLRVAQLIRQGHRLVLALRVVRLSDRMDKGCR